MTEIGTSTFGISLTELWSYYDDGACSAGRTLSASAWSSFARWASTVPSRLRLSSIFSLMRSMLRIQALEPMFMLCVLARSQDRGIKIPQNDEMNQYTRSSKDVLAKSDGVQYTQLPTFRMLSTMHSQQELHLNHAVRRGLRFLDSVLCVWVIENDRWDMIFYKSKSVLV